MASKEFSWPAILLKKLLGSFTSWNALLLLASVHLSWWYTLKLYFDFCYSWTTAHSYQWELIRVSSLLQNLSSLVCCLFCTPLQSSPSPSSGSTTSLLCWTELAPKTYCSPKSSCSCANHSASTSSSPPLLLQPTARCCFTPNSEEVS